MSMFMAAKEGGTAELDAGAPPAKPVRESVSAEKEAGVAGLVLGLQVRGDVTEAALVAATT